MTDAAATSRPTTMGRDHEELRRRFTRWFAGVRPEASSVRVSSLEAPSSNGMSSETLLFDVEIVEDGRARVERCVARLAPRDDAVPVFPTYDLERQFRLMRLVAERTTVPVPVPLRFEPDPEVVGSAFVLMERVEGLVPPDVMPYTFGDNWLHDAAPEERRSLQDASVEVLAAIHAIDATAEELTFLDPGAGGSSPLGRNLAELRQYYQWVASGGRVPILERCFAWFEDGLPAESPPTLSWGDARIGNILYRDFRPVAVLDWEMATVAPPEVDLGWMIYLHWFFQDLAEQLGLPGLPDFMVPDEVATTYERASGRSPRDLDRYIVFAALRHGVVMARVQQRAIAMGDADPPEDPDDLVMHRATLEEMLAGTYRAGSQT